MKGTSANPPLGRGDLVWLWWNKTLFQAGLCLLEWCKRGKILIFKYENIGFPAGMWEMAPASCGRWWGRLCSHPARGGHRPWCPPLLSPLQIWISNTFPHLHISSVLTLIRIAKSSEKVVLASTVFNLLQLSCGV